MIPIYNAESQLIGFGGRIMDQRIGSKKGISTVRVPAKYINSPASALFSKRHTLYGLPESLPYLRNATQAPALIVEGYFDVISLHQCGVRGTLACLGTALTREQLLLAAYAGITEPGSSPRTVVLLLDEDAAGQRAMHRFCIEVCLSIFVSFTFFHVVLMTRFLSVGSYSTSWPHARIWVRAHLCTSGISVVYFVSTLRAHAGEGAGLLGMG